MDECTFCITVSFKAEGYTESTLIHRGCPAVIFRIESSFVYFYRMMTKGKLLTALLTVSIMVVYMVYNISQSKLQITKHAGEQPSISDTLQTIMQRLQNIEKHLNEHSTYTEYKSFRDKIKLALPKIIKGESERLNPHVLIDQVEKDHQIYKILVLVSSNAPHDWRREQIRQKWGNKTKWTSKANWRVIFVTGGTEDRGVLNKVHLEAEKYKDVILEDIPESFYALSQKVMIGLQWAHSNFHYDFILKCDDDIFVQIDRLMHVLDNNKNEGYIGQVMVKQPVMRKGRYGLTDEEHKNEYFDPYCSGGAFLISFDTVNKIIPLFDWDKPLKIDDAYIGQLVFKSGVESKHEKGIHLWNRWCEYTDQLIVSHPVKIEQCMDFLLGRSLIENGRLVNNTLKNQKYAFDEETRKKL